MSLADSLSKPRLVQTDYSSFSSQQIVSALRTIVAFTITDVFDLDPEESLWTSYHIGNILSVFDNVTPKCIPASVMTELTTCQYSDELAKRETGTYLKNNDEVQYAALEDWVNIFMDMITSSYYPLRPLVEASIRGQLSGVLKELGVDMDRNPRGALYLPNAVRYALSAKKFS